MSIGCNGALFALYKDIREIDVNQRFGNYTTMSNVIICNCVVCTNLGDWDRFAGSCPNLSHDAKPNKSGREVLKHELHFIAKGCHD